MIKSLKMVNILRPQILPNQAANENLNLPGQDRDDVGNKALDGY
jgi:hypothetical protein